MALLRACVCGCVRACVRACVYAYAISRVGFQEAVKILTDNTKYQDI